MATAVAASSSPLFFRVLSTGSPHHSHGRIHRTSRFFVGTSKPSPFLSPLLQSRSFLVFSRRSRNSGSAATSSKNKKLLQDDHKEGDNLDEDALEALFSQLEEDLKNDDLSAGNSDDEISEENLARLEQELEDAFGDGCEDELSLNVDNVESHDDDADKDEDEEEERPLKLKTWQLRRLASALKIGRRKTSIKSLSGELGLDRAVVLELLRDPPPNLLLMCASLPDTVVPTSSEPKSKPFESSASLPDTVVPASSEPFSASLPDTVVPVSSESFESKPVESSPVDVAEPEPVFKGPIHVMRSRWSMQKRLKKVQLETLEKVYSRTKRPTNAMIGSIVHVTNLPRKRVVKWFEEKRQQDGVSDERIPYRRSIPETVSMN